MENTLWVNLVASALQWAFCPGKYSGVGAAYPEFQQTRFDRDLFNDVLEERMTLCLSMDPWMGVGFTFRDILGLVACPSRQVSVENLCQLVLAVQLRHGQDGWSFESQNSAVELFPKEQSRISTEAGRNQGGAMLRAAFYLGRDYLPDVTRNGFPTRGGVTAEGMWTMDDIAAKLAEKDSNDRYVLPDEGRYHSASRFHPEGYRLVIENPMDFFPQLGNRFRKSDLQRLGLWVETKHGSNKSIEQRLGPPVMSPQVESSVEIVPNKKPSEAKNDRRYATDIKESPAKDKMPGGVMKVSSGKEKVPDIAAHRHPRSRRRSRSKSRSACRGRTAMEKASSQGSRHDRGRLSNEPSHRYSARDNPTKPIYTYQCNRQTSASYGQHGPTKYSGSQRKRGSGLRRPRKRMSENSGSRSSGRRPKIRSRSRDKKRVPVHYLSRKEDSGAYLRYTGSTSQSRDSQSSPQANDQRQDKGHQQQPQGAHTIEQVRTPPYVTLPSPTPRQRQGPRTPEYPFNSWPQKLLEYPGPVPSPT
ncbi:MAG: hypothetical protein GY696_10515 [Gammaproteobacteria bacterium]|nr:hypothetical protein [Gammaproteobacteria bacterium]